MDEALAAFLKVPDPADNSTGGGTASDLECASYLAQAGLSGCLANVEINLRSLKEPGVVAELSARVHVLRKAAVPEG